MSVISMKQLLEAGVHFGHQTRRWNPKMAPYIYTERNGIYIIDLQKSVGKVDEAYNAISEIAANGGTILFVGTKKQAQDAIKTEAERCGMYYVNVTMAAVTAAMVKELREMTGAGMMDCKKALASTDGDMDKAVEFLREKGLAGAAKKAGRIAAEGIVDTLLTADEKKAVIVEVNAETDFVAKNEKFRGYVADVAAQALVTESKTMDEFFAEKWAKDETLTVKEALSTQISVIGKNMNIRRFERVNAENGFVASYIHAGGKIGVLVEVETDVVNDAVKEMAKNVAMQAAALKPVYTSRDEVVADYIEHEKSILLAQIQNDPKESSKPEKVIQGMIQGRINKELKEICLLDQVYVKAEDGKQTVGQYIDQVAKANGAKVVIKKFVRYETGEGMEKKNEDFAAEVAKQICMKFYMR